MFSFMQYAVDSQPESDVLISFIVRKLLPAGRVAAWMFCLFLLFENQEIVGLACGRRSSHYRASAKYVRTLVALTWMAREGAEMFQILFQNASWMVA